MNNNEPFLQKLKSELINIKEKWQKLAIVKKELEQIGTIKLQDDKIVCYLEQSYIDEHIMFQKPIVLPGIVGGNKISYVCSKLTFNNNLIIYANDANLTIEYCNFNKGIEIKWADLLVLKHNNYAKLSKLQLQWNQHALITGNVENLIISNNSDLLDIEILANKEINIINSKLMPQQNGKINLNSNVVNIYYSRISEYANIKSNVINQIHSSILYEDDNQRVRK